MSALLTVTSPDLSGGVEGRHVTPDPLRAGVDGVRADVPCLTCNLG